MSEHEYPRLIASSARRDSEPCLMMMSFDVRPRNTPWGSMESTESLLQGARMMDPFSRCICLIERSVKF